MKAFFVVLVAMLFISACGNKPQAVSSQGQEGHGGDLAVTRARSALYMNAIAQERRWENKDFLKVFTDALDQNSLPTWKIISASDLKDKMWEWRVDSNGKNVLVVNRERMRTVSDERLMEESSLLLFGFAGVASRQELMANDLEHGIFQRQDLAELFGAEKQQTKNRIVTMFNKIRNCNPQASLVSGTWHARFRDARAEVLSKSAIIEKHVASLPMEKSNGELFASAQNAQVDFLSQQLGPDRWKIFQDIHRSEGWEAHQNLISAVLTHEVAHTLGLTTVDSDYVYSFATIYCM